MRHFFRKGVGRFVYCGAVSVCCILCARAGRASVVFGPPPPPPPVVVSLSVSPENAGTVSASSLTGSYWSMITVTAIPHNWMVFDNWSSPWPYNAVVSTNSTDVFQFGFGLSLIANFRPLYPGRCMVSTAVSPADAGTVQMSHGPEYYMTEPASVSVSGEAPGFAFCNWTIDGIEVGGSRTLTLPVTSNCTVVANFRPFFTNTASYAGVFSYTNYTGLVSAGLMTISCSPSGACRGTVRCETGTYNFKGQFGGRDGGFGATIGAGIYCEVNYFWGADRFTNSVIYYYDRIPFVLERQRNNSLTNPAPESGTYTLAIAGQMDHPEIAGDGYATMRVQDSGVAHVTGALANGTKFSASTIITEHGRCPVFASLNGKKEFVAGWLDFNGNLGEPSGEVLWIKQSKVGQEDGFVLTAPVLGSAYVPAGSPQPLLSLQEEVITFEGGGYEPAITQAANFKAYNIVEIGSGNSGNIVVSPKTGLFHGQFRDPVSGRLPFNGVVLQNYGVARGYFLRNGLSGSVRLGD